jgi:DNA processing protein
VRTSEEQALLLALCRINGVSWTVVAREAQRRDGLDRLRRGEFAEHSPQATRTAKAITNNSALLVRRAWEAVAEVRDAAKVGARLVTVVDPDYPVLLRLVFNAPPFLFVRGDLVEEDLGAVALAGGSPTRGSLASGVAEMAAGLVLAGATVVCGMGDGVEAAVRESAREAGGRVLGVCSAGVATAGGMDDAGKLAVVLSPFWPTDPAQPVTSARYLATASGLAQGTFVGETSASSPGRLQAFAAVEQGRKVFMPRSAVERDDWARRHVAAHTARLVDGSADVVSALVSPERIRAEDRRRLELAAQFG